MGHCKSISIWMIENVDQNSDCLEGFVNFTTYLVDESPLKFKPLHEGFGPPWVSQPPSQMRR